MITGFVRFGRLLPLAVAGGLFVLTAGTPVPASARGPEGIADTAEKVIDAVVNISTSQTLKNRDRDEDAAPKKNGREKGDPRLPPDSPFNELFDEFFKNRRGDKSPQQHKVNSLGSGFIIDTDGFVVTNNHVIADADEINVILNDGSKIKAELIGRDKKSDLAVLKFQPPEKKLTAVKFGDSDKLRLGEWVVAIGNPFSLGGTVTAGIVSARNRDINSGPYDNYIQTDAAINRGNSGGPLFNLEGEVVGVNTAIISPSGGSIGIGFAVPSNTVVGIVNQLRQYKEVRRGWLGVRIQQVTDEIADSLGIKPPRGALVAGVDDKGPAKPAGIEAGDVIISFDGKAIREMKDLPRAVADAPVGKNVDVVFIRKGKEETRKVTLGRLDDGEKLAEASLKVPEPEVEKTVTQKALGLDLASLGKDLRTRYKIKDKVKGVVIVGVDRNSDAAERRLSAGDVIVEVAQEAVNSPADVKTRIDKLKKDGKKSVLLQVSNGEGELRFVALSVD
ncbi:Do family serine endopeptidase [Afipia carboxidovorans]|uniref:Do family serine endopeptidase n=1 Tax=Afipia carboxidovorans TaxID=40137 RepID=UPI003086EB97|nr:Do family serine endopeptidase [Afipia carboxidovorans]